MHKYRSFVAGERRGRYLTGVEELGFNMGVDYNEPCIRVANYELTLLRRTRRIDPTPPPPPAIAAISTIVHSGMSPAGIATHAAC